MSTQPLDYEEVKDFFYAKLSDDRYGRGRMESAFFHTASFIFAKACARQAELEEALSAAQVGREAQMARVSELEAALAQALRAYDQDYCLGDTGAACVASARELLERLK